MPNGPRMGRALAKSQGAFITPIVTNNPAFQVKMLNVDDRLEQQAGTEKQMKDDFEVGNAIVGREFGEEKKKQKGKITKIVKDEDGTINAYMIDSEEGETLKIDPTTAERIDLNGTGRNKVAGAVFRLSESGKSLSYNEWKTLNENKNR